MNQDTEKTIVIFRKWPLRHGGDVIALFPCLPGSSDSGQSCLSYQHVGQHGAALGELHNETHVASPAEYESLKRELEGLGYNLDVRKRSHPSYYQQRRKALGLSHTLAGAQ